MYSKTVDISQYTHGFYLCILPTRERSILMMTKRKEGALTACMRKLLTILNAMLRDRQPFRLPA